MPRAEEGKGEAEKEGMLVRSARLVAEEARAARRHVCRKGNRRARRWASNVLITSEK